MKNRQSEVIIDNDSQKVVDLNKANKSSAYFKIFLFLALGLILTSLVTVGFSYLFTILLKKDIIVTPVEKRLQRVENYIQMLKIQMKLL